MHHYNLVNFLRQKGKVGKTKTMRRNDCAAFLNTTVRQVQAWAEEARNAGIFLCYSSSKSHPGMYLAESTQEKQNLMDKIERECRARLRQRSALKRALISQDQLELL